MYIVQNVSVENFIKVITGNFANRWLGITTIPTLIVQQFPEAITDKPFITLITSSRINFSIQNQIRLTFLPFILQRMVLDKNLFIISAAYLEKSE